MVIPPAVVMSVEDLESLEETLDVTDSEALLADSARPWLNWLPLTRQR